MNFTALAFFIGIVLVTLAITYWASRKNVSVSSHYVANKQIKPWQNGLAIAGDYISAATVLGATGAIALSGFGGFYLAIGVPISYALLLLVLAEPMRGLGKYTMADVVTMRFNSTDIRALTAVSSIIITVAYMVAQFLGAGVIIASLLGINYTVSVIIIGVLMTLYVALGGMLATTWIQILQMALLGAGLIILVFLTLARFDFNPLAVFGEAVETYGAGTVAPSPEGLVAGLENVSLSLALAIGLLGLPHILIRFLTVSDARAARNSALVATWTFTLFYILLPIIGYGALVLVGREAIVAASAGGNLTVIQLAELLGGNVLLAYISAAAFIAIMASLAGMSIAASGAFAHDLYTNVFRRGEASEDEQHRAARIAAVAIPAAALLLALGARDLNVAFLAVVSFAIAASTNLPILLLTVFWRRFNVVGAITGMATGLLVSVSLVAVSPSVMGEDAIFPLTNPALVCVPIGFVATYLGTVLGRRRQDDKEQDEARFREIRVRANT
ncbi:MAG: cation acetate symporter [Rubrobacter sp.]|nr:cation acetate symporter [Rubrobacter sp.]